MCEPSHSIIQYDPPGNDDDAQGGQSAQSGEYVRNGLLAGLGQWSKRIKRWFHLSMLGKGHSETIGARSKGLMHRYDSTLRLYEAHWWNRQVTKDGAISNGNYISVNVSHEQLQEATEYAKLVSIGDLGQLRRFLEQSLEKTDRQYVYLDRFRNNFLNKEGREEFDKKCQQVFNVKPNRLVDISNGVQRIPLQSVIKYVLGFTRKRKLIVPEWADDTRLWTPKSGKLELS